jgi:hypothetical protein
MFNPKIPHFSRCGAAVGFFEGALVATGDAVGVLTTGALVGDLTGAGTVTGAFVGTFVGDFVGAFVLSGSTNWKERNTSGVLGSIVARTQAIESAPGTITNRRFGKVEGLQSRKT